MSGMPKRCLKRLLVVPIYDVEVMIVVSDTVAEHVEAAKKHLGGNYGEGDFGTASSMFKDHRFASFFLRSKLTHGHIAHELFHNTIRILNYCGVKLKKDNHEAQAYLNDYLHRRLYQMLAAHKEVIVD